MLSYPTIAYNTLICIYWQVISLFISFIAHEINDHIYIGHFSPLIITHTSHPAYSSMNKEAKQNSKFEYLCSRTFNKTIPGINFRKFCLLCFFVCLV